MKKAFVLCSLIGLLYVNTARAQKQVEKQILPQTEAEGNQENAGAKLISFAKTMIGIPYRYASSNPNIGFDCSGFVNYVFKNFGFTVPRSSPEFVFAGRPVKLENAKVGDILIFTGSNPKRRKIGHVGIVYKIKGDQIEFIHSSSGKSRGVTITTMDHYYKSRFMKAVSLL